MKPLFLMLKDYAIDLEVQRDLLRDTVILTASSENPEKFTILDRIQKLYNNSYKTPVEKLIEGYKKEFKDNSNKEMTIKFNTKDKKKVRDLVKLIGQK